MPSIYLFRCFSLDSLFMFVLTWLSDILSFYFSPGVITLFDEFYHSVRWVLSLCSLDVITLFNEFYHSVRWVLSLCSLDVITLFAGCYHSVR